jgi:hypothetical protein
VAAAPDGEVRMAYAAHPGVVGDGWNVIAWGCDMGTERCQHRQERDWDGRHGWSWAYEPGPVRVTLRIRDKAVVGMRVYVGGAWRDTANGTDLGLVPARSAASYLLGLARQQDLGRDVRDAVFAASLADSVVIWRDLLALARDHTVRNETRKQALFWLGQQAEDAATRGLDSIATTTDDVLEVREAAVFALSQRPRDEGVPALIRIARTNKEPRLRRRALFWLAQSGDARALDLFEEILTKQ